MDVFEAVADPHRRALLDLLARGERSVGELATQLPGLTQPAVSHHLRMLRQTGLVEVRTAAQRRIYTLRRAGFAELATWLEPYRLFWNERLDALERHLAQSASGDVSLETDNPQRSK